MSEEVQNNSQQTIVIALVVIAALMAAIVGILIWQQVKSASLPEPTAVSNSASTTASTTGMTGTTSSSTGGEFDPKTAPKVPAGTEPIAYVRSYYQLCEKGQYDKAFPMLPTATQAYYGDAAKFKSTLVGYGITGFTVKAGTSTATQVTVIGTQKAQGMEFAYTWTLVKQGSTWLVKSREMGAK